MHVCPVSWLATGCMTVNNALVAHAFSAGTKCWHCTLQLRQPTQGGAFKSRKWSPVVLLSYRVRNLHSAGWQLGVRPWIMPWLPTHLVQELNVGTVHWSYAHHLKVALSKVENGHQLYYRWTWISSTCIRHMYMTDFAYGGPIFMVPLSPSYPSSPVLSYHLRNLHSFLDSQKGFIPKR